MRQEQPKQDAPKIDTAYAEEMARKLSALRSEFVKAMVQSAERTSYQPNPIYERQANEIESISKTISEQSRTIKSLQEERDKLGIFKGREKKNCKTKLIILRDCAGVILTSWVRLVCRTVQGR